MLVNMKDSPKKENLIKRFAPDFSNGPIIMGIVNVTPDSFSDGGKFLDNEKALEHALRLEDEGAGILDIGGESSRPYAEAVSEEEEIRRVIPLISKLGKRVSATISIDTTKARVAKLAVEAGASIINDISAMTMDSEMLSIAASTKAAVVLMHMKGEPRTMQIDPVYYDVVAEIIIYLKSMIERAEAAGIEKSSIIVDPGIGFGKNISHNLALINAISEFKALGSPVLIGPSRKSFIQKLLGADLETGLERVEAGTLAVITASLLKGADIIRVHDARAAKAAVGMITALQENSHKKVSP